MIRQGKREVEEEEVEVEEEKRGDVAVTRWRSVGEGRERGGKGEA